MSKSINKVIVIGHLGKDPEIKVTTSGVDVANFSVATSESWKDNQTGETQERTEWHRIVLYRKMVIVAQMLEKGSFVYVEGKLSTRKWQDVQNNNITRYMTEIIADKVVILNNKKEANTSQGQEIINADYYPPPPPQVVQPYAPTGQAYGKRKTTATSITEGKPDDWVDDDIPF